MQQADTIDKTAILALIDAKGELALRVVPGARVERVAIENGIVKIWTRTAAENGRANTAALSQLAMLLDLPTRTIELLSGATSREKRVRICA
jgi:uncharacterized protein YggU (UPF0235/DUF167 family)